MTALKLGFALLLLLGHGKLSAAPLGGWNGFISQGWVLSDHNNFYGDSSDSHGSFDYRELGLNGFIQLNPQFKLNGQMLSRRAGGSSDGEPEIDYLFADWSPLQQADQQAGIRVGRIKNPLGFYNATRDIAFTRPGVIMPQSIYFDQVRELQLSSDGVALYYRKPSRFGDLFVDIQQGQLQTGDETEALFLGEPRASDFSDSRVRLVRIMVEPRNQPWRFGLTGTEANFPFGPGEVDLSMVIFSAQYNLELWSFTTEMMQANIDWTRLGPLLPDKSRLKAIYLQADYRVNPKWQMMARIDHLDLDAVDHNGAGFNLKMGFPGYLSYAKDWTLGLRYQPSASWDLKTELHRIEGAAWLSRQDNPNPFTIKRHWNMLLFQAAYRF
ncbi:MAG: hypothetical protein V7629_15125 [Motiliproteus sp.]